MATETMNTPLEAAWTAYERSLSWSTRAARAYDELRAAFEAGWMARDRAGLVARATDLTEAPALTEQDRIGIAAHKPIRGLGWCRMCKHDSPCLVEIMAALLGVEESTR